MKTILYILGFAVAYVVGFYVLLFIRGMFRWLMFYIKYLNYGYFDFYKLHNCDKSRKDSDECRWLYQRTDGAIHEDYQKALEHRHWLLGNLLDSASIAMRCHNIACAKNSLQYIKVHEQFFRDSWLISSQKTELRKKWYRANHYCWMLQEWDDVKFLEEVLFDTVSISCREVPYWRLY